MLSASLGIALAAAIGFWIFGGVLLRAGGILVSVSGLIALIADHSLGGILALGLGFALWLIGHWHFAYRHHFYKSALANRTFHQLLPRRLDPTRDWAWPVTILDIRERRPRRGANNDP